MVGLGRDCLARFVQSDLNVVRSVRPTRSSNDGLLAALIAPIDTASDGLAAWNALTGRSTPTHSERSPENARF
jgi:hypothetical protein